MPVHLKGRRGQRLAVRVQALDLAEDDHRRIGRGARDLRYPVDAVVDDHQGLIDEFDLAGAAEPDVEIPVIVVAQAQIEAAGRMIGRLLQQNCRRAHEIAPQEGLAHVAIADIGAGTRLAGGAARPEAFAARFEIAAVNDHAVEDGDIILRQVGEDPHLGFKLFGKPEVVAVLKGNQIAPGRQNSGLPGSTGAGVAGLIDDAQARVINRRQQVKRRVGGGVIHHDQLDVAVALRQDAVHRPPDRPGAVVGRDDDTDQVTVVHKTSPDFAQIPKMPDQ